MSNEAIRVRLQELKAKLCCISDQITEVSANTSAIVSLLDLLRPVDRIANVLSTTGSGSTSAGVYSVSIANVGAAAGIVNGQSIPAGTTLNFDAGVLNNTLGAITYNATGTTFIITYLT
jgi:hypothetical protein